MNRLFPERDLRLAGDLLHFNVAEIPPTELDRFAGAVAVANPELVDRIKATIAQDVPEPGSFDESPE